MTPRVLFIGGLGRSGSTLLELLLAQRPDVCGLGEVVHLWQRALIDDERCGCGAQFSGCHFWQAVGEHAFGGWSRVDPAEVQALGRAVDRTRHLPRLTRSRLPPAAHQTVRRYTSYYARIYRAALTVSGARVVVDASKHASLAFALRWAEEVDLRVLHLVRDSRGVAYSWAKAVRRPEVADRDAYMPRFSPLAVSVLWLVQNLAFERLAHHLPTRRLRYEDFARDPESALAQVRALAELTDLTDLTDFTDFTEFTDVSGPDEAQAGWSDADSAPRPVHSVAGNPLRFAGRPLRVRADEEWRVALPRRRRWTVGALTLPLSVRYGYLGRATPALEGDA